MLLVLLMLANLAHAQESIHAGECPDYNINISTGIDNAGNPLSLGSTDPYWNASGALNTVTTTLVPYWSILNGSQWLGGSYYAGYTCSYSRYISIPANAVGTITFQALADNSVDIYLDGNLVAQTPYNSTTPGYNYVLNYTGKICPGIHMLKAIVYNDLYADVVDDKSPVGFNLSGNVSYTVVNTAIDISTSLGTNYVLLSPGMTDPNWTCSVPGYTKVQTQFTAWSNLAGSKWIGDNSLDNAAGQYLYDRSFNIPASEGCLVFDALADNNAEYYLDGNLITQTPGTPMSTSGFQLPALVMYSGGVGAGTHTLQALVQNNEYQVGLNLHGRILYCKPGNPDEWGSCATEPAFTAMSGGMNTVDFYSSTSPLNYPSGAVSIAHSWDFGDGKTSVDPDPVHTYGSMGTYTVTHTISKKIYLISAEQISSVSCDGTKTCHVTIGGEGAVSIRCNEHKPANTEDIPVLSDNIAIYPNPAYDEICISGNIQGCDLQIFSLDGRKLVEQKDFRDKKVDISKLATGTYNCRIIRNETITNIKFSKSE